MKFKGIIIYTLSSIFMIVFIVFIINSIFYHSYEHDSASHQYKKQGENYGNVKVDRVISVYDGDTFTAYIEGWPEIINNIPIRLMNIDTPEIKGKCEQEKKLATESRNYLHNILINADEVELRNMQRDKYFRILSDVYADDVNLSEDLIEHKLAVGYDGGVKKDWCEDKSS